MLWESWIDPDCVPFLIQLNIIAPQPQIIEILIAHLLVWMVGHNFEDSHINR